jgi:uncharacterized protein (DUF58 family)
MMRPIVAALIVAVAVLLIALVVALAESNARRARNRVGQRRTTLTKFGDVTTVYSNGRMKLIRRLVTWSIRARGGLLRGAASKDTSLKKDSDTQEKTPPSNNN